MKKFYKGVEKVPTYFKMLDSSTSETITISTGDTYIKYTKWNNVEFARNYSEKALKTLGVVEITKEEFADAINTVLEKYKEIVSS